MPTVDVAKIKLRRGSNSDRKLVTLDEGELGYTTDTNRVYVGNGTTLGGSPTSVYNFGSDQRTNVTVQQKAESGDLIFDSNGGDATLLYSLTGDATLGDVAWTQLSPGVDNSTIEYNANGHLAVIPGSTVTGGDSINVTGETVSVDYDTADTNTFTFFTIGATPTSKMVVSDNALTTNSHGPLSYQNLSLQLLHTLATADDDAGDYADGFMSRTFADKCYYAPDWSGTGTPGVGKNADAAITDEGAGNRTISFINVGTQTINGARVNFSSSTITSTVQSSNALKKVVGQSSTTSNISAVDMMTPNNFFNREDFPGTVMRTAVPNANIDNIGNYANFTITNVAFPETSWEDKAFLLPGGNGVIYGIFVLSTGATFATVEELYPQVTWASAAYDAGSGATMRINIIGAINSFTNSNGERIFDAWEKLDASDSTVYIQGLVKGKTPTYATAFAQTNLNATYRVALGFGTDPVWANAATSIDYTGTVGDNAGANSSGKIGSSMYGWVNLNAQDDSTFQQTLCCTGFAAKHTVAQFPAAADCTNGEYFLIYDTNWNRTCVYYFETGSGSIVVPDISTNPTHRGRRTEMIMVEYPEETGGSPTTSDQLATATKDALELNDYFTSVYIITYASPTMTFDSVDVGWTDGIVKRQGVFPGCIAAPGTPIQFITNITGLSGEPNSSALLGAFYNLYQEGATATALLSYDNFVLPQYSNAGASLFYDVTLPSTAVDAVICASLLKYR